MTKRPLILVTNDDGIASPGLHAAAEAVAGLGDLLIAAPSSQQTGAGRSYRAQVDKTFHLTQIPLNGSQHPAYTADVSPAQVVSLALLELAKERVDLCVSGINYGENIGSGVTISGTVGAAIEAGCSNIPALAVSLETPQEFHRNHSDEIDFSVAAHFTRHFARKVLARGLPDRVDLLKIDVPASATPQTAWQMAKVSRQRYYLPVPGHRNYEEDADNFGYHIRVDEETLEPDSDIYVFAVDQQVSVVPITIDLTAPVSLQGVIDFLDGSS
ncbi:MAG: 5'/3'-nucleotidase SurE [Anaerolineae bacterium]|nr:5'/3'-nucleotidase SurE [Anaerolineae bacterium]